MCSSPRLIAAYHDLHRLSMPRHPPCALLRLISISFSVAPSTRWQSATGVDSSHPSACSPCGEPTDHNHPSFDCQRAREPARLCGPTLLRSECELESDGVRATSEDVLAEASLDPTCRSRKEVIQPQVPLRLPCYDFAPVTELTFGGCLLAVSPPTSGPPSFHGVTGGVYKARERIHRGVADPRLLAIPASCSRVADYNPNLDRLLAISAPSRVGDALYRPL
jgi:hypothetical protein